METNQDLESDIASLCREAKEQGASLAVPLPAENIFVDDRARLKCIVPLCSHYGRDLLCPPNTMPISQFKKALKKYQHGILLKADILSHELGDKKGPHPFKDSKLKLYEIMNRLEAICMAKGYPFAAGLVAGSCSLCDECVGVSSGLPCRYPFKARPSMEALGIDVLATAKKAGVTLSFAPDAGRSWIGLLLVC